jgi:hypothetical protein
MMVFFRLFEILVQLAAVVTLGGALAISLSDLLQGKIRWEDVETEMRAAAGQVRALFDERQPGQQWRPGYALVGLLLGLAYGLTYEGALTGIVGAWVGLTCGAMLAARAQRRMLKEDTEE